MKSHQVWTKLYLAAFDHDTRNTWRGALIAPHARNRVNLWARHHFLLLQDKEKWCEYLSSIEMIKEVQTSNGVFSPNVDARHFNHWPDPWLWSRKFNWVLTFWHQLLRVVTLETIAVSWGSSSIKNNVQRPVRGRIILLPIARGVCKKLFWIVLTLLFWKQERWEKFVPLILLVFSGNISLTLGFLLSNRQSYTVSHIQLSSPDLPRAQGYVRWLV